MRWRAWPGSAVAPWPMIPNAAAGWPLAATPPRRCSLQQSAQQSHPGRPGVSRAAAWTAQGLRVPSRTALLADIVLPEVYGRAYGFERAMDNLGAIAGPLLGCREPAAAIAGWLPDPSPGAVDSRGCDG
jgi:hypothetical protein